MAKTKHVHVLSYTGSDYDARPVDLVAYDDPREADLAQEALREIHNAYDKWHADLTHPPGRFDNDGNWIDQEAPDNWYDIAARKKRSVSIAMNRALRVKGAVKPGIIEQYGSFHVTRIAHKEA